jgi:hypothetical protein
MTALDTQAGCACQDCAAPGPCDADLPDSPDCAINYHFGMLLGVDDFRTEQGFHVGRLRRHQRALHGFGVVYGFAVSADPAAAELRVGPGYAIDAHGRDLALDAAQCLGLPAWWLKHRGDDEFADVPDKDDVTFDADVRLCYAGCLARPVPAIADACAGGNADIAYSRICEAPRLALAVRRADAAPPAQPEPVRYHLLRVLLGLEPPALGADGKPLGDDQWLLDGLGALGGLPGEERAAALDALWRAAAARATATAAAPTDAASTPDDELADDCLAIATLRDVHIFLDQSAPGAAVWKATVKTIDIDRRPTLLPTHVLQDALQALATGGFAGPVVTHGARAGQVLTLEFDKPLAAASVSAGAFSASAFDPAAGWSALAFAAPAYDGARTVTLTLAAAPPTGARIRVTVTGSGPTPLLGADFIPAGARTRDSDGANLSTTIAGE